MRVTSKGQVTIPPDNRERAGLLPLTEAAFAYDGETVRVFPAPTPSATGRGARLVAPLRGRGDVAMSTNDIMALARGG